MRSNGLLSFLVVAYSLFAGNSYAASSGEEGVFIDESTGDYVVQYKGADGSLVAAKFYPSTKVSPYIKSSFGKLDEERVSYRLKLKNGSSGRQDIEILLIRMRDDADIYDLESSAGWESSLIGIPGGWKNLSWSSLDKEKRGEPFSDGLSPGSGYVDFMFSSRNLPGVSIAQVMGKPSGITGYPDEGPARGSDVRKKVRDLERNDYVPRHVAAPVIAVAEPFSAAQVLAEIRGHVAEDIASSGLIDGATASNIDRILQEAFASATAGNVEALEASLREARQFIRRAYPGVEAGDVDGPEVGGGGPDRSTDLLVARLLIFNIDYLERRVRSKPASLH